MSSHLDPLLLEQHTISRQLSRELVLYALSLALVVSIACFAPLGVPALFRFLEPLGLLHVTAGCKRIGLDRSKSNLLNDEYSAQYAGGSADGSGKSWRIKSLWIYPIKSCTGVELASSDVIKTGLDYDRHFMFAHYKKPTIIPGVSNSGNEAKALQWEFATIREYSRLCNVKVELWLPNPDALGYSASLYGVQSKGVLRVIFPYKRSGLGRLIDATRAWFYGDEAGTMSFHVPYQPTMESQKQRSRKDGIETVRIWKDFPSGLNMASYVPRYELEEYLGARYPVTLFRSTVLREVFRDAPRKDKLGWQPVATFNDAYPINLLGLSSVHDVDRLQDRSVDPKYPDRPLVPRVSARRFRANMILEGTPAYQEERWTRVRIGAHTYYVVARCVRCKIPSVDPDTGFRHPVEPDRAIRKYRAVDAGAPKGKGCMAVQLVPSDEQGTVQVGDVLEVLEEGEHVYTQM